jgi:hypothetical protein
MNHKESMEWLRRKDEGWKRQLEEAKQQAAREGKEPFDFAKLLTLYDPSSEMSSSSVLPDPEATAREYEAKYYFSPEVKTVAEFAQRLNEYRMGGCDPTYLS